MKKVVVLILIGLFLPGKSVMALGEEQVEGRIVNIIEEKENYQKLEVQISENQKTIVENDGQMEANYNKFHLNQKVMVDLENKVVVEIVRRDSLLFLLTIFAGLTILVAKGRGLLSILGMVISFEVIFRVLLPLINKGFDPVLVAIGSSGLIIPLTFVLSHGFNKKTYIAMIGTLISLIITGVLAKVMIDVSYLSGISSEEAGFLMAYGQKIEMKGLLLAGIIIGVLGVLDDVTVSQAAIVQELKETNPKMKFREIYKRAMNIGQDHIASMINTLVLVYAGASMPLLLLFINNPLPYSQLINFEMIAEEIVRTLVGSIGLVLAVPITTFLAAKTK